MLNEFTYRGKNYCIKTSLEKDYKDNQIITFDSLDDVRAFFLTAVDDPAAWPVIMTIAKWNYPGICHPPANCMEPSEQDILNALCIQVYSGALTLIEKNQDLMGRLKGSNLRSAVLKQ